MVAGAQGGEFFGGILDFQHRLHRRIRFGTRVLVGARSRIKNLFTFIGINASARLLAQCALFDQCAQPGGCFEVLSPWILPQRQFRTLEHMPHGVQTDDIGSAIGGALGPTNRRASQCVHQIQPQPECLGVMDGRRHRKYADAVGDKVRGVLGPDHALAEGADQEGLQLIENRRRGSVAGNQLHQRHVARRVKEMNPAEACPCCFGHRLRQHVDRQAGGVGRQDRPLVEVGGNTLIQIGFPVRALGDGLDQ